MYVTEQFKEYQKDILKTAKKKDLDYINEIFANTELFDISNIKDEDLQIDLDKFRNELSFVLPSKMFSLPFQNCFLRVYKDESKEINSTTQIFIKEYAPDILTGSVIYKNTIMGSDKPIISGKMPFVIRLKDEFAELQIDKNVYNGMIIQLNEFLKVQYSLFDKKIMGFEEQFKEEKIRIREHYKGIAENVRQHFEAALIEGLIKTQKVFEKLSKCEIIVDRNEKMKPEYYTFKDKSKKTIKVTNRPIYYVLGKKDYEKKNYDIKAIGKLEYSHAFKVRGHWRRIDEKSIGKDRNGDYKIEGFTWVTDYIKGDGELVNRVRIVR